MSTGNQRRSDLRAFRRELHRDHILTHLIDASVDLSGFRRWPARRHTGAAEIPTWKPFCSACRSSFAEDAQLGAYLFATPPGAADIASVSGLGIRS